MGKPPKGCGIEPIRVVKKVLGEKIPLVAVFDPTFHSEMPEWAYRYSIPYELTEKHYFWRYEFHRGG